jgi:hypothetical protein
LSARLRIALGSLITIALVWVGLWYWQRAIPIANDSAFARPEVLAWAIRAAALGAISAGQLALLVLVVGSIYRRRRLDVVLRLAAGMVSAISLVSASAFALSGG